MHKASEILSKPVINLAGGNFLGTTKDLCFSEGIKKLEQIILFDDESEEEKSFSPKNIYALGTDAIIIKALSGPLLFERPNIKYNNPINNLTYNAEGVFLGKVTDVELNNNFVITNLYVGDKNYNINTVLGTGQGTVLINTSEKKIVTRKPRILTKSSGKLNRKVTTLPINNPAETQIEQNSQAERQETSPLSLFEQLIDVERPRWQQQQQSPIEQPPSPPPVIEGTEPQQPAKKPYLIDDSPLPQQVIINNNFLTGRKVTKTIYGLNNEILAKKDSYITEKIIWNAKNHSKLAELAVYSVEAKKERK